MTCDIDKKLLPIKLHYALFNAGVAPLIAFGPVIARQMGISALTTGCMYTVLSIFGLLVMLILSGVADKYKQRRLVLSISTLFSIISSTAMLFLPTNSVSRNVSIRCHNLTLFESCRNHGNLPDTKQLWRRDPHDIIQCEIECTPTPDFVREVNTTWKESYFDRKNISFSAWIEKKHVSSMLNCLRGTIREVRLKDSPKSLTPMCDKDFNTFCSMKCDNAALMTALRADEESSSLLHDVKQLRTWMLFIIYVLSLSGSMLSRSMSDTICFEQLGDQPEKYGAQRLFGALALGFTNFASGWIMDWFSHDAFSKNYDPLFCISTVLLLADLFLISRLQVEQNAKSSSVVRDVWVLMYSLKIWIFAVWCLVTGFFGGVTWQFLYWHLEDMSSAEELQWSKTLEGSANVVNTVLGELLCFFISGWIIKKLGDIHTMSLVLFSLTLPFFCYSILLRPWWVLPVELISGFGFSITYVVMASYSSMIALPGTESTVQALFSAIFNGFGLACAGVIGGIIYHQHRGYVLYSLMSYTALIAFILHVLIECKIKSRPVHEAHEAKSSSIVYTSPNDVINMMNNCS